MSTTRTLVQLSARLDQKLAASGVTLDFARKPEDENSGLKTAGKIAGVGALGVGGLYLRGRSAQKAALRPGQALDNSLSGIGRTIATGGTALKGDVGSAAAKVGAKLAPLGAALNSKGRDLLASSKRGLKAATSKIPFRKSGA